MDFVTVVDTSQTLPGPSSNKSTSTKPKLYRQPLLEPLPFTIWACIPFSLNPHLSSDPISFLVDLNSSSSPLDSDIFVSINQNNEILTPVRICLGVEPTSNFLGNYQITLVNSFPDALDHIVSLYHLSDQLSKLQTRLCVNFWQITKLSTNQSPIEPGSAFDNQVKYVLAFAMQRSFELQFATRSQNQKLKADTSFFQYPTPSVDHTLNTVSGFIKDQFKLHAASVPCSPNPNFVTHNPSSPTIATTSETNTPKPSSSHHDNPVFFTWDCMPGSEQSPKTDTNLTCRSKPTELNDSKSCYRLSTNFSFTSKKPPNFCSDSDTNLVSLHLESNVSAQSNLPNNIDLSNSNNSTDSWSNRSASFSDNLSYSGDMSETMSAASSLDDWTKPYQILFELNDCHDDDDNQDINSYFEGRISNKCKNVDIPEEIGLEAFDWEVRSKSSTMLPIKPNAKPFASSPHKPVHNLSNDPDCAKLCLYIYLDKLQGEADSVGRESRFWIRFQNIEICNSARKDNSSQSLLSGLETEFLWHIFTSLGTHLPSTTSFCADPPWVYFHADLSKDWHLIMPQTIYSNLHLISSQFWHRGGFKYLNACVIEKPDEIESLPKPKMAFDISFKNGYVNFEIGVEDDQANEELVSLKQILLNQGIKLCLNPSGLFHVSWDNQNIPNLCSILTNTDKEQNLHNLLLNRYASENRILKDKVCHLTEEVDRLKSALSHFQNTQYNQQ